MKKLIILMLLMGCSQKESFIKKTNTISAPSYFDVLSEDDSLKKNDKNQKIPLKEFNKHSESKDLLLSESVDDSVTLLGKSEIADQSSLLFVEHGNIIHAYIMANDQLTSALKLSWIGDPYAHVTTNYQADQILLVTEDYECVKLINKYEVVSEEFIKVEEKEIEKECDDSEYEP